MSEHHLGFSCGFHTSSSATRVQGIEREVSRSKSNGQHCIRYKGFFSQFFYNFGVGVDYSANNCPEVKNIHSLKWFNKYLTLTDINPGWSQSAGAGDRFTEAQLTYYIKHLLIFCTFY